MKKFENQFVNVPFHYIKGSNNCYFTEDGKVYNVKTKRFSKKKIKNCSVYYNIDGKLVLEKNVIKIRVTKLSGNL